MVRRNERVSRLERKLSRSFHSLLPAFLHFISSWLDGRARIGRVGTKKEGTKEYSEGIARDAEIRLHGVCAPVPHVMSTDASRSILLQ